MLNKKLAIVIGTVSVFLLIVLVSHNRLNRNSGDNIEKITNKEPGVGTDICAEFPKETIATILEKQIIKTEEHHSVTTNTCSYFVDNINFVTLRANSLNVQSQKDGQVSLGRTITSDPSIKMDHFVVKQENGLINEIVLVLNPNLFVAVDRSSTKAATEAEIVKLASKIGELISITEPKVTDSTQTLVPLPQGEDIVRNFFNLIDEGRVTDAVGMMSSKAISDESQKQAWGVEFNAFEKVSLVSIEAAGENQYKIVLDVKMKPESANAIIPYYGFFDGENTRWVLLEKENGLFKVVGIATGP